MRHRWLALLFVLISPLAVFAAAPTAEVELKIVHVVPEVANVGDEITLRGQGFRPDSVLLWDNTRYRATVVNSSTLTFEIPDGINCGSHTLQIENPIAEISGVVVPLERSQLREIFVNCGPVGRLPNAVIDLDRVEPSRVHHDEPLTAYGTGFVSPGTKIQFDNQILNTVVESETKLSFRVPEKASCGMHSIRIQSPGAGGATIKPTKVLWIEVICGEFIRSPSIAADFELTDFDRNGDCHVQNLEIFLALDAWINQQLFDDLFFEIVDAWVTGSNICGPFQVQANSVQRQFEIEQRGGVVSVSAASSHVRSISAQVLSLNGRSIYRSESPSGRVLWRVAGDLANGVYMMRIETQLIDGRSVLSWHPLVLLR